MFFIWTVIDFHTPNDNANRGCGRYDIPRQILPVSQLTFGVYLPVLSFLLSYHHIVMFSDWVKAITAEPETLEQLHFHTILMSDHAASCTHC
jgi:hypothetical protein